MAPGVGDRTGIMAGDQKIDGAAEKRRRDGVAGRRLQGVAVMFGEDKSGHFQITFASFFSLSTRAATFATLTPAARFGGASTRKVVRRGAMSSASPAAGMISNVFLRAFMMLGRLA